MVEETTQASSIQEADFAQLLDTGRLLWPTYFQLAAMTFAWNASMAAGAAFIYLKISANPDGFSETDLMRVAVISLSAIGVIYNAGALCAYILMNKIQRDVISALEKFPEDLSQSVTSQVLRGYISPGRFQALKHLTHLFFLVLCVSWLFFLIAVVRL